MTATAITPKRSLGQRVFGDIVLKPDIARHMSWKEGAAGYGIDCCYALHPPRKAKLLAFYDEVISPLTAPPHLDYEDVVGEPAEFDLFELMAQWNEEDDEEDAAYMRKLQEETRALRHRSE